MPAIKQSSILNLKARIDIVDVVSAVVSLKRAGSKFKGLSPFNPEKTPSFFVSPDKGLFKCFSSGKAGDVISFVMETERLNFTEAVETLARRFNVPLEYESGGLSREQRSLRQELFELHEVATSHFHEALLAKSTHGDFIRRYWTESRQFPLAVAEDFKVGLAEPDGGRVADILRKRGFSDEALRQSGLFYVRGNTAGGPLPPRFRGRLMIPIRDHQGRVVAFTARQLEITPADDPTREAKYVNSPETPVFTKGQLLFNLDRARSHVSPDNPFLMVEGQLDAIRCFTAGLTAAIAPQGTGVTDTQLHLLRRYHAGLECLLDGDSAGQKAALRLLPLALREGLEISFLPLTGKTDPDALVRERGAEAIHELRRHPLSAMAFATRALAPDPRALSAQHMSDACRELFAIVREAGSEVAQAGYIDEIATLLGINRTALENDFRRFRDSATRRAERVAAQAIAPIEENADASPPDSTTRHSSVDTPHSSTPPTGGVEADLLLVVLHFDSLGKALAQSIHHEWINTASRAGRLLDRFLNDFSHDVWPGVEHLDEHLDDPEDRNYIASLCFDAPLLDDPLKVANDGIRRIVSNFCDPKLRKIELEIAAKQGKFDADLLLLLKTTEELRRLKHNPPAIRHPV